MYYQNAETSWLEDLIDTCEEHDIFVYVANDKKQISFQTETPAGEDWWEEFEFNGTLSGLREAMMNRFYDFDIDDETALYIPYRGQNGVPSSISVLLHDAEWKSQTLEMLTTIVCSLKYKGSDTV